MAHQEKYAKLNQLMFYGEHGKMPEIAPKGPRSSFPPNLDLADILGDADLEFVFFSFAFWIPHIPDSKIPGCRNFQKRQ